jgi:hypothetical protein
VTRALKRFTDVLQDIRGGDVIHELTDQLREVVTRVTETGRPGELSLKLKVKPASKGAGATLIIEDDIKVKLPVHEKGTTILYATKDGDLQRNDPRQPQLVGMERTSAPVVPIAHTAAPDAAAQ